MSFEADIEYKLQVVFLELTLKERKNIMQSFGFEYDKSKKEIYNSLKFIEYIDRNNKWYELYSKLPRDKVDIELENLKIKELESFKKDFNELINEHKDILKNLKMGINISYRIDCVHYAATNYSATNDQYSISESGEIGIEPVYEWND